MSVVDEVFVENLRRAREHGNLSQKQFAHHLQGFGLNVPQQLVARIEGRIRKVTLGEAVTIASALGLTVVDMIDPDFNPCAHDFVH